MQGFHATLYAMLLVAACIGLPVTIIFATAGCRHDPVQGATVPESELEG